MKEFLKRNVNLFFSVIILGGLLWGIIGIGQLFGNNWNLIHILLGFNPYLEGGFYLLIGLCTLSKTVFNLIWEKPNDPPHIVFILFVVVSSGLYWGVIGVGLFLNHDLYITSIFSDINYTTTGLIYYSIGIFTLIKLFNYIFANLTLMYKN